MYYLERILYFQVSLVISHKTITSFERTHTFLNPFESPSFQVAMEAHLPHTPMVQQYCHGTNRDVKKRQRWYCFDLSCARMRIVMNWNSSVIAIILDQRSTASRDILKNCELLKCMIYFFVELCSSRDTSEFLWCLEKCMLRNIVGSVTKIFRNGINGNCWSFFFQPGFNLFKIGRFKLALLFITDPAPTFQHITLTLTFDPENQKIVDLQSGPTSLPKIEPLGPTVWRLQPCTNERKTRKYIRIFPMLQVIRINWGISFD